VGIVAPPEADGRGDAGEERGDDTRTTRHRR
jgi:hypothetical protein